MNKNAKKVIVISAVAIAVAYEVHSRRAIMEKIGSEPMNKAVAYHGAMTLYGNLAEYFGRKAMMAETEYWKVVRNGT